MPNAKIDYGKKNGRDCIVSLINFSAATTCEAGSFYAVLGRAASSSALPDNAEVGHIFYCEEAISSLATGDVVKKASDPWLEKNILGFGNSKDVSQTKNTYEDTVDWDDETDNHTENLVNRSGNVNGYKVYNAPADSAPFLLEAEFIHSVHQDGTGDITAVAPTAPIHMICYADAKAKPAVGEEFTVRFFPVSFNSCNDSASYGGATSLQMAWTGAAKDANGIKATKVEGKAVATAA